MGNWLEQKAIEEAEFDRNGVEIWRNLKIAVESVVDSFNKIYCQSGVREFETSDCMQSNENCLRVRKIPNPGEKDRYFELRFLPERRLIAISQSPSYPPPNDPHASFGFKVLNGKLTLTLGGPNGKEVAIADASQYILEPFLFASGPRIPLNPPRPPTA